MLVFEQYLEALELSTETAKRYLLKAAVSIVKLSLLWENNAHVVPSSVVGASTQSEIKVGGIVSISCLGLLWGKDSYRVYKGNYMKQ